MAQIENYGKLKKEFGWCASWALWAQPEADKIKSNVGDWSVLTDENILGHANTDYVFVGLNASVHEKKQETVDWCNFHSQDNRRQQDYKLRYALSGTKYWGAYMTDIIKGLPCKDSAKVTKMMREDPEKYHENICCFREELKLLAGDKKPVLIAMGNAAHAMLKPLRGEFEIRKITHYSAYCGPEKYKSYVHKSLGITAE